MYWSTVFINQPSWQILVYSLLFYTSESSNKVLYGWKKTHLVCFRWTLRPAVCDLLFECYDSIGEPYTVQRYTGPYLTFGPFAIRWKEPHAVVQHRSLFLSHWTLWFSPDKWLSNSTVITKHIHLRTKVHVVTRVFNSNRTCLFWNSR